MMDAKQAVEMLHNHYGNPDDKRHRLRFYLRKSEANEIADLIESLAAKAELIDIDTEKCAKATENYGKGKCPAAFCERQNFCRLRAGRKS